VTRGQDVVQKIGAVPRDSHDRPRTAVKITEVVVA